MRKERVSPFPPAYLEITIILGRLGIKPLLYCRVEGQGGLWGVVRTLSLMRMSRLEERGKSLERLVCHAG